MEMRNKLDEEIRSKLENLESEPSAKVWMNIRKQMPGYRRFGFFTWSIAAAAALLLFVVGFLMFRDGDHSPETYSAKRMKHNLPLLKLKLHENDGIPFQPGKEVQHPGLNHFFAQKPLRNTPEMIHPPKDEIQIEKENSNHTPLIKDQVAIKDQPLIIEKELISPKEELDEKIVNPDHGPLASNPEIQHSKKGKNSSPLKLLSKIGSEIFGMRIGYKENADRTAYAFNADLGFLKIEKIKSFE